MLELHAGVVASILEGRSGSAAFEFLVLIVGHPAAYADLAYSGKGFAIFATQVDSLVLQSHKGGFFRVLVSVMIVIVVMAAAMQVTVMRMAERVLIIVARQAILASCAGIGHADTRSEERLAGKECVRQC